MARTSSPTQTIGGLGVLLAIVGIAALFFYTQPMVKVASTEANRLASELSVAEQEQRSLIKAQQDISIAKEQLRSAGVDVDRLGSVVPATEDMPTVYYQLQDFERLKGGLVSYDFAVGQPSALPSGVATVPVTIQLDGSYAEVKRFIADIQKAQRPFNASSITMAQNEANFRATVVGSFIGGALSSSYAATPAQ